MEMASLAKDGIEIQNLLGSKAPVNDPTEPIYEIELTDETEAES